MVGIIPIDEIPDGLKEKVRKDEIKNIGGEDWHVETRLWGVLEHRKNRKRYIIVETGGPYGKAGTSTYIQYLRRDGSLGKQTFWIGQNTRETNYQPIGGIVMPIAVEKVEDRTKRVRGNRIGCLLVLGAIIALVTYLIFSEV